MTILEQRFMECVPSRLKGIEDEVRSLASRSSLPIIKFNDKDGNTYIEQFKSLEAQPNRFLVNGNFADETEYRRIENIISNHPLFKN